MQDNTLHVTVSENQKASSQVLLPLFVAAGAALAILTLLFAVKPYASGYGAGAVTVLHFANAIWKGPDGDWLHCYLVPFAVAAMVYFKRRELHLAEMRPSFAGLALTVFGFAVYWVGFRADNIYVGYASFQLLTGGLLLWFCGWTWFRKLFFAWAFLVFLYPIPFLDFIAFPLRMIMSEASVHVLNLLGIGAVKSGTAILSAPDALAGLRAGARFSVDVANPCSGIRSLFALMMVSALFGYFTQPGVWRKIFIFLCAAPLAILGNLARILMLTMGTIAMGAEVAIGTEDDPTFFHMLAGYLVFGVAISALLGIARLLDTDWPQTVKNLRAALASAAVRRPPAPASATASKAQSTPDEY